MLSEIIPLLNIDIRKGIASQKNTQEEKIFFLIGEHHPLLEQDNIIHSFANDLPYKSEIIYYTSLEEPLMKALGSDKIIPLMEMLGVKDGYIEHPVISSSIIQAQKKIKNQCLGNQRVKSAQEWFYYNCPNFKGYK